MSTLRLGTDSHSARHVPVDARYNRTNKKFVRTSMVLESAHGHDRAAVAAAGVAAERRPAQDVTFIDDRSENVLAAHTAGMRATLFTSSSQLKDPAAHETVPEDVGQ